MQQLEEPFGILAPAPEPFRSGLRRGLAHTLRYWMETEVHVFGFSIAANVLLSFFPFLIVILSLMRGVFGLDGAATAIDVMLADYFPGKLGEFIGYNLKVNVQDHRSLQVVSVLLLLFTANGVFDAATGNHGGVYLLSLARLDHMYLDGQGYLGWSLPVCAGALLPAGTIHPVSSGM